MLLNSQPPASRQSAPHSPTSIVDCENRPLHEQAEWLQQAVAGEEIGIRTGNTLVVLRPLPAGANGQEPEPLSPREALRRLQQDARLTPAQAESYLSEVCAERLAAEDRGAA